MKRRCCNMNSKYKNVSHVIFDLDGTLLDTEHIYIEALQKVIEFFGGTFKPEYSMLIAGRIQQDVASTMVELLNLKVTPDEFSKKYEECSAEKLDGCGFMPGAEKMVRHLHEHNIPIAVATSSSQSSYDYKTKSHKDLFDLFHHIVCGGSDKEVKAGKPAPDIFLLCASRFDDNPPPEKCLVFEDSVNGVKAAIAANMQVIMIPDLNVPYESWKLATLRLDSFDYMIPQLFGLPPFSQPPDIRVEAMENKDEETK
ncbi:hypothetical protein GWI33_022448 [Rhynchophorus ferrugineus]|uniref:Pseudouridine-5'-phosphatase n=1 Tax=Rhynchophorus ferrugineus TaxID=354439 RepID=A0A834IUM9_RHYFE|nr:hypothetical protein GWI33_022448 [Rhynchophorus ferrugineus]